MREQSRSLVIGDVFEPADLSDLLERSGGEVAWQGDGLAVICAAY